MRLRHSPRILHSSASLGLLVVLRLQTRAYAERPAPGDGTGGLRLDAPSQLREVVLRCRRTWKAPLMITADDKLMLAKRHLERVRVAWDDPTDWADLSIYGFYALEAAVDAACLHVGAATAKHHPARAVAAAALASSHGLPNISELLRDLNEVRKHQSYGDVDAPELSAEETAAEVEAYVGSVAALVGKAAQRP